MTDLEHPWLDVSLLYELYWEQELSTGSRVYNALRGEPRREVTEL